MPKKTPPPENTVSKPGEANILISQDRAIAEIIKMLGARDVTFYR